MPAVNRYAEAKEHDGRTYRGMKVGGRHDWTYPDGRWVESKVDPKRWRVAFTSRKQRNRRAPSGSGAEVGSGYHWLIVGHQWAEKLDANTYATHLEGDKFLVSFRKPGWRGWTTQRTGHKGAREHAIAVLEALVQELRDAPDAALEDPQDADALAGLRAAHDSEGIGRAAEGKGPGQTPPVGRVSRSRRRRPTRRPPAARASRKRTVARRA